MNEEEQLAKEVYDFCCAAREKNGNPRNVGCEFENLFENAKEFYRNVARWHLNKGKLTVEQAAKKIVEKYGKGLAVLAD